VKYFKIGQDRRIPYGVMLTHLDRIDGYSDTKKGNFSSLDYVIVSTINLSPINFYPDILDRQIIMVKGAVKDIFDIFLPELEYKHCCLVDNNYERYDVYYIPLLDVFNIQEGIAQGRHLFYSIEMKEIEVLASLEVIEAILRRKPMGVRIIPINYTKQP